MSYRFTTSADVNRSAIIARLGANGPESRAQLARTLKISPALMSQLTRQLILDGLLVELEQTPSQGGRPARLLGLNAMAGHAVGVKLDKDHATFVELAIDSTLIRSAIEPLNAQVTTYIQDLIVLLKRFVGGSAGPLLGIGIGVPGSVDEQGHGVVESTQLNMHQMPLGATLQREMDLPVIVENNVNALTIAERLYGLGRHHESFLVVTVGPEIGAGLMVDGMLYRGHSGGAGDIGHLPIQEGGPICSCGNHGCLQAIVGQAALVTTARAREVIGQRGTITALGAAADAGDEKAQAIFSEAGHVLGRAVAGLAQTLDPEIVILLGEATASWNHWSFGFEPAFRSGLAAGRRGIPVVVESWQDLSWAQGAAALVFATPFDVEGMAGEQGRLIRERLFDQSTGRN
jgi:predicted NBD/HSP70 family sugar kinase